MVAEGDGGAQASGKDGDLGRGQRPRDRGAEGNSKPGRQKEALSGQAAMSSPGASWVEGRETGRPRSRWGCQMGHSADFRCVTEGVAGRDMATGMAVGQGP